MIMNRSKALIAVILLVSMLLSACGNEQVPVETTQPTPSLSIQLTETVPEAKQGTSYDLSALFVKEKGVKYSAEVTYVDPVTNNTESLIVKSMEVTPLISGEMTVTITAKKNGESVSQCITVPVEVNGDILDMLFATGGAAADADSGVNKTVNIDRQYLNSESSGTSLKVSFTNPADESGTKLFELSQFEAIAYYTSRVWDNAAVVFSVFNPTQQDVEFRLTSYNPATGKSISWGEEDNTQHQVAKAGQWTQIVFALYPMGIEQVLYNAKDGSRPDQLCVLARTAGEGECTIYVDGLDIVPAKTIDGLETGFVTYPLPNVDLSDILDSFSLSNNSDKMVLRRTKDFTNNSKSAVCFSAPEKAGWPSFNVMFGKTLDLRGYSKLRFDVYAKQGYPFVGAAILYKDSEGNIQRKGTSFDFRRDQWYSLSLSLHSLEDVDLSKVVGISFSVNVADAYVENGVNEFYFDNVCFTADGTMEPIMPPAIKEDDDLISGPVYAYNTNPGYSGVCKVSCDNEGVQMSNSTLLLWANTPTGYPSVKAEFMFDEAQDWSEVVMFSFDTHTYGAHYRMDFYLITYDAQGNEVPVYLYYDAVLTQWMTHSIPIDWFVTADGSKPDLSAVYGLRICVDLAVGITETVGHIFIDNVYVS
jgi:hypothetical protein